VALLMKSSAASDRTNIFKTNAAKLCELQEAIKSTYNKRSQSTRQFQASLKSQDPKAIEETIRFLEADPLFFRSGYIKADFIRFLCKSQFREDQLDRLRHVILSRIQGPDTREFRSYCRLARVVSSFAFQEQVAMLSTSPDRQAARHAQWVLQQLNRSNKKTAPNSMSA